VANDRTRPLVGIIGGTGVGDFLTKQAAGDSVQIETPFGPPSAPLLRATWEGIDVVFLLRHGPGHLYPPSAVPYRANVFALKAVGCTHVLASGATGSLREEIAPRDLVIPDQVIDRTVRRPSSFFDEFGAAVHVEFSQPFCPTLRRLLLSQGEHAGTTVHDGGTYVCMEGPAFSALAESRMHRAWGGDLIGMTCLPEAKLAREAEMCYALIALATDYDCWRPHDPAQDRRQLLREIMDNLNDVTQRAADLLAAGLREFSRHPPGPCACQTALDLAIWSKVDQVPRPWIERLRPILARRLHA